MHACTVFLGKTALKPTEVLSSASGDGPDENEKTLLTPCNEASTHQEDGIDSWDSRAQLKEVSIGVITIVNYMV